MTVGGMGFIPERLLMMMMMMNTGIQILVIKVIHPEPELIWIVPGQVLMGKSA